jgi:hypothetical protein
MEEQAMTKMWDEIEEIIGNSEFDCQMSALDERATDELWAKSEPRYYVYLTITNIWGYKKLTFNLFHTEMPDEEVSHLVVLAPSRTLEDTRYPRSHVEQTFSKSELRQLYGYWHQYDNTRLRARRAKPPGNNSMGSGAQPVGGRDDFQMFDHDPEYSLPFKVWGYYSLDDPWNEVMG